MNERIEDAQYEDEQTQRRGQLPTTTRRVDAIPVDVGLLRAATPAEMVKQAELIATPLAEIISRQNLYVTLGKGKHVLVEGWTTMLAMLGVTPVEKWCKRIECTVEEPITEEEHESTYFEVYIELRRCADGQVIGGASAECGGPDEIDWHFRPKNEFHERRCPVAKGGDCTCEPGYSKTKVPVAVGTTLVQPNARRSMAGTRATSKAARLAFSWIIELAGFKSTPAEEMTGAYAEVSETSSADARPAAAQNEQQKDPAIRMMKSKYPSKCAYNDCPHGGVIDEGAEIAYHIEKRIAVHRDCFIAVMAAKEQAAAPKAEPAKQEMPDDDLPY